MATSIADTSPSRHRQSLEAVRPSMAKADLKEVENRDFRSEIGAALVRMRMLVGETADQVARELGKDPAQISRWEKGSERPALDAYMAVERYRFPMLIVLAGLLDAEVVTTVQMKRTA
ncbi:MAG: helix-turn-helix domain-containing protein [Rhodanobacter sp.]